MIPTLENFLEEIQNVRRLSQYTVRNYNHAIQEFFKWMYRREKWTGDLSAITKNTIRGFLIEKQKTLSRRTLHNHASALKSFFRYAIDRKILEVNPCNEIVLPKLPKNLPKFLTESQIVQLISSPMRLLDQETIDPFEAWRDRLVLELLYGAGLRVSELVHLNYGQIGFHTGVARILGKGQKERQCPLGAVAMACLKKFQSDYAQETSFSAPVLITKQGKRLSIRRVQLIVKKYLKLSDLPHDITPHKIRHSYATHLLNHGMDIRLLQELLGHASLSTTQIYTHVDMARLKAVHNEAHPRA